VAAHTNEEMVISYRLKDGEVERRVLSSVRRRGEAPPAKHMSETILKALYSLECEQKFRSSFTKNTLKRVHEEALQRHEHESRA
jgi:hypothetical protein